MAMKLPPAGMRVKVSNTAAGSRTLRVTPPSVLNRVMYSLELNGRGTRPRLAFNPTRPQNAAGRRIEPPPSFAIATGNTPAATIAADPPDEPPAVCDSSNGLRVAFPV